MTIRRRRVAGELIVEQTRDLVRVTSMLEAAAMTTVGVTWPAACYLMAFIGDEPAGIVGVESRIDAALLRSLTVIAARRRQGIGAALVQAARKAAHTRGSQRLYTLARVDAAGYFARFGFVDAPQAELIDALRGTPLIDHLRARSVDIELCAPLMLDISRDGVIVR
jgi:N-acetylglutamate synthase-like GNAT family acetyltransferase